MELATDIRAIVWIDPTADLQKEIVALRVKKQEAEEALKKREAEVQHSMDVLRSNHPQMISMLSQFQDDFNMARAELEGLLREKREKQQQPEPPREEPEEEEDEEQLSEKEVFKRCKKIYQQIARRCHPDKTKNVKLHEAFIVAKRMFRALDYYGLMSLYDSVLAGVAYREKSKEEELRERMAALKAELQQYTGRMNHLMLTVAGQLHQLREAGHHEQANLAFLNLLNREIEECQRAVMNIRQQINAIRNPPPPNPFSSTFYIRF